MAKPKLDANQVENFEYDNTTSGLTATTGQDAIDEIVVDLAGKLPVTGDAALAAGFEVGIATNENKVQLPTGTGVVIIEGGTSPTAKGTLTISTTGITISFDEGATEYFIRKGGVSANEDIINKQHLDGRLANMVESDLSSLSPSPASGVQINNIVALNQSDYDNLDGGSGYDPNTYYLITDSATNYDYIAVACSGTSEDLTTGDGKAYFRMPYSATLASVRASVWSAPTGANIQVQIRNNASDDILIPNKLTIDAGEETSITSATSPTISFSNFTEDDKIRIDIDQVGSTAPGQGLIVTFEFIKN